MMRLRMNAPPREIGINRFVRRSPYYPTSNLSPTIGTGESFFGKKLSAFIC